MGQLLYSAETKSKICSSDRESLKLTDEPYNIKSYKCYPLLFPTLFWHSPLVKSTQNRADLEWANRRIKCSNVFMSFRWLVCVPAISVKPPSGQRYHAVLSGWSNLSPIFMSYCILFCFYNYELTWTETFHWVELCTALYSRFWRRKMENEEETNDNLTFDIQFRVQKEKLNWLWIEFFKNSCFQWMIFIILSFR